jgi:hypothetical protein
MEASTHTVDEIRILYIESPVQVKARLKAGDKIFTDNDWLESLVLILKKCDIAYGLETHDIAGKSVHAVTIS